jgi:creatinine amidohydrolase
MINKYAIELHYFYILTLMSTFPMKIRISILLVTSLLALVTKAQVKKAETLPVFMDELTSPEFSLAIKVSGGTCIIPIGIIEKHGTHLPLATDLITARDIAHKAAEKEYTIIFPPYYFGQIFESKHQPGTIAYSHKIIFDLLQETCDELSRNGISKIILVNGHGGNNNFLHYFCQVQLEKRKEYAVILFEPNESEEYLKQLDVLMKTPFDMHAGEIETSVIYTIRPDLVHAQHALDESGADLARLDNLPYGYSGIWWYSKFPNQYAGDGSTFSSEVGELYINTNVEQLVELIRYLKKHDTILELQKEFYNKADTPTSQF